MGVGLLGEIQIHVAALVETGGPMIVNAMASAMSTSTYRCGVARVADGGVYLFLRDLSANAELPAWRRGRLVMLLPWRLQQTM